MGFSQHRHCGSCDCRPRHTAGIMLRQERVNRSVSLTALARATGYQWSTISAFERGLLKADPTTVALLFDTVRTVDPTDAPIVEDHALWSVNRHCLSCSCFTCNPNHH